jgi:hypothetical protein
MLLLLLLNCCRDLLPQLRQQLLLQLLPQAGLNLLLEVLQQLRQTGDACRCTPCCCLGRWGNRWGCLRHLSQRGRGRCSRRHYRLLGLQQGPEVSFLLLRSRQLLLQALLSLLSSLLPGGGS